MASRRHNPGATHPKPQRRRKRQVAKCNLTEVLHRLVDQSENPALLIELYYWSQEKELAALMRNYMQLPETSRRLLSAFLDIAKGDPVSVGAKVCHNGDVVLSSAVVADMLKRLNQKLNPAVEWPEEAKSIH
jgi:hypothetical protein